MTARSAAEVEALQKPRPKPFSWRRRNDLVASKGPGQCSQEGDDGLNLVLRQVLIELRRRHLPHGVIQGRSAAVMKIRRCRRDIAQTGHTQDLGLRCRERTEDAVPLIEIASDIHTLMTGYT